jgi:hypothetical protein
LLIAADSSLANLGSLRHICRVAADHFSEMALGISEKHT